jgi:ACS family hexuronate transporter-like MFS transporter
MAKQQLKQHLPAENLTRRRYETRLVWLLGMAFGLVFFDRNMLNYLMVFIKQDISITDTQIGILASSLAIVWALSGFTIGRLSDKIGHRKMLLVIAIVGFSLASISTGLAVGFTTLLLARALMGFFEGPVLPIAQTIVFVESSPERRGKNMGLMQNVLANLFGSLLAPILSVYLATHFGWRITFFLTIIPGLILAFYIAKYVREPVITPPDKQDALNSTGPSLFYALKNRNILLCMLISGLMVGWMLVAWIFLPIYLTENASFTVAQMSYVFGLLGVVGAGSGFLIPWLSDHVGRKPVVIGFCSLGVLASASVFIAPSSQILLVTLLATGWIAAGTFSIFTSTIPSECLPRGQVAAAMGLIMGFAELFGGAAMPVFAGYLADAFSSRSAIFILDGSLALMATILACFLIESSPAKRKEELKYVG